jgi:hypothetical protein
MTTMMLFNVYDITSNSRFNSIDYPKVTSELIVLKEDIAQLQGNYKKDMLVSYLKDHCMMSHWIEANPKFAKMITSGFFDTPQIESLFEACRKNAVFLAAFEDFVKSFLEESALKPLPY